MNWSYLAGFFDGEGHLSLKNKYKGIGYWEFGLTQKNREVLEVICEFLGGGFIFLKSDGVCFQYSVYKQQEVKRILECLLPFLIVKYDKTLEVIRYIRKHQTGLRISRAGKRLLQKKGEFNETVD